MTPGGADLDMPVDLPGLARWMDQRGLGAGAIEGVELLAGGTQNILLRFRRAGERYVLRRPPLHKRAESDAVMRREMRVLTALASTRVPHPRLIAGEADDAVLGAAFYLMADIDGFNPAGALPAAFAAPARQRAMGEALVDALVALAQVDVDAVGLGDLSRSDAWLARQVPRWRRQFDGYGAHAGWSGRALQPAVDTICDWLVAHQPAATRRGLMHGDYHLANVLYRHDAPTLAAVVDWELASLGDPLLDLGWLLATWPDGEHAAIVEVTPWAGFPTAPELVARYVAATPRDLDDIYWFSILACLKLGVILEGTHARAGAGLAPRSVGDRLHAQTRALFDRALARIQSGNPYGL